MSSDKNFPQHITKRSLEKLEYISIIHYSNFIKTPTIRVYFSSFAFKKYYLKSLEINAEFLNRSIECLKFPYLVHLFRHYCVKITAACPFFFQGEHNTPLSSIFFSCPVRFFFTPFPFTQCPYTHVHEEVACFVSRNDKHRSLKSRD